MNTAVTISKVTYNGIEYDMDAVVELMNDELREKLHRELAPCSDQEFFDAYAREHKVKYGHPFTVKLGVIAEKERRRPGERG